MTGTRRTSVVAVVVVALVLAGCSSAESTADDGSTTSTAAATPTTDDRPAVVESDDGSVSLEIPAGALPDGTELDDIAIRPLTADDLPPPLAGSEVRSTFYSLEPDGLQFDGPVTLTRRFDAAASGFSLEGGQPLFMLAQSDPAGEVWDVPPEQRQRVDDGTIVVSAEIDHFSYAYTFGGRIRVSLPDFIEGEVGADPLIFPVSVETDGPPGDRGPAVDVSSLSDLEAGPGVVLDSERVIEPPFRGSDLRVQCERVTSSPYSATARVDEVLPAYFVTGTVLDLILPQPLTFSVVLTGTVQCSEQAAAPDVGVDYVEVCVVHTPIGDFPSHLEWLVGLVGDLDAVDSVQLTVSNGANGGNPVDAPVGPDGRAMATTGIPAYGSYTIESLTIEELQADLTADIQALLADGVTVDASESCTSAP